MGKELVTFDPGLPYSVFAGSSELLRTPEEVSVVAKLACARAKNAKKTKLRSCYVLDPRGAFPCSF